jgi:hypothetical protein
MPTDVLQRDGAHPRCSRHVTEYLNEQIFDLWLTGHGGPQNWPLRSLDLTPPPQIYVYAPI